MIDWARVAELRDEIGAEDFGEIVEIFLEEVDATIAEVGSNPSELEAQLHFLKGSALNLGFSEFSELCQEGESKASQGDTSFDLTPISESYRQSRAAFISGLESQFAA